MQLGMIGLGRMGGNMVRRLQRKGHECVVYGTSKDKLQPFVDEGAVATTSIPDFIGRLRAPRAVWLMVPAAVVDGLIDEIAPLLIVTKLEQYDYAGATAVAFVLLVASFVLLFAINLLQGWSARRVSP